MDSFDSLLRSIVTETEVIAEDEVILYSTDGRSDINSGKKKLMEGKQMKYDVIIIGAGPGGIFSAYELIQKKPGLKIAIFEAGHALEKRHCPIDGEKVKSCIGCKSCSIMSGFVGA